MSQQEELDLDPLTRTLQVYLDDGRVFEYEVRGKNPDAAAAKAREHASAIAATGYRHNDGKGEFEHYPPHRVAKIKVINGEVPTEYADRVSGT